MKTELRELSRTIDEYALRSEDALSKFILSALSGLKEPMLKFPNHVPAIRDGKMVNIAAVCYNKECSIIHFVGYNKNGKRTIAASYKDLVISTVAIRNEVIVAIDELKAKKTATASIVE